MLAGAAAEKSLKHGLGLEEFRMAHEQVCGDLGEKNHVQAVQMFGAVPMI